MLLPGGLPDAVPYGADLTIYVVVDGWASPEGGEQERRVEHEDFDTVVTQLIAGQFSDPQRVLAFNTLEHWSQDVSSDVAREIEARCDMEAIPVPEHLEDFLDKYTTPSGEKAA